MSELDRLNILEFLSWNDRNGCYLDVDVLAINQHPFTEHETELMFWDFLFRDKILTYLYYDNALELNYFEVKKFLNEKSLLGYSYSIVNELKESIDKKVVYRKVIDNI